MLDTQDLARRALERLRTLTAFTTHEIPEHLQALKTVAAIARDTTEAGLILADAVTHVPFATADVTADSGQRQSGAQHDAEHERARQAIAEAMHDASRTLQACATACLYAAAPLANRTETAPTPPTSPEPPARRRH